MGRGVIRSVSLIACLGASLSGCGTYTPAIQEFWGNSEQAAVRENDLVRIVRCETGIAISRVFRGDGRPTFQAEPGHPVPPFDMTWFDGWGIQVALTLTVIENSNLSPSIMANKVKNNVITTFKTGGNVTTPQSFAFGAGGTISSTGTRTDVIHLFYRVADLRKAHFLQDADGNFDACPPSKAGATLFTANNFRIYEWLSGTLLLQNTQVANLKDSSLGQQGQNGISHEVKFEIVSNGNINPTWKLVNINANAATTPLLSAGRDRIQDLIITMGPLAQVKDGPPQLIPSAEGLQLSREIGAAVAQALANPQ
jgi:hypothetical protein